MDPNDQQFDAPLSGNQSGNQSDSGDLHTGGQPTGDQHGSDQHGSDEKHAPADHIPSSDQLSSGQLPDAAASAAAGQPMPPVSREVHGTDHAAPAKKVTIMDLARYRVGEQAYWIVFRTERSPDLGEDTEWIRQEHPWLLWQHKVVPWGIPMKPPRMHPGDTMFVLMLCGQRPKIEPFRIRDVTRSANSGSFLYTGPKGVVMPEALLFPTKTAARREITRVAKMFAAWTATWEGTVDSPPKPE